MTFTPLGNSNIDFSSLMEAINSLQRNPQLQRFVGTGNGTVSGVNYIYSLTVPAGTAKLFDGTAAYEIGAPGQTYPFGAPTSATLNAFNPGVGQSVGVTVVSTGLTWTMLYK